MSERSELIISTGTAEALCAEGVIGAPRRRAVQTCSSNSTTHQ